MSDSTEEIRVRTDGPPPSKRRRIAAPAKPRTTAHIDLENHGEDEDENLQRLMLALRKKKKIVVIAGAGISVSAGSMFILRWPKMTPPVDANAPF
jgi:NAD-dependent histone deacetylase SIR2